MIRRFGLSTVVLKGTFQGDDERRTILAGADLFVSYGFQELFVREIGNGAITVAVELYDMGTALNAFGIFRTEKSEDAVTLAIGAEAVVSPPYQCQMLIDHYYMKIEAIEGDIDEATGRKLLADLAVGFPFPKTLPAELSGLPAQGRVPGSERYRRSSYQGLGELRDCLHADYEIGDLSYQVFLVLPSAARTNDRAWEQLAAKWEWRDLGTGQALLREIPYKGPVAVVWGPDWLTGIVGIESEATLLEALSAIAPE